MKNSHQKIAISLSLLFSLLAGLFVVVILQNGRGPETDGQEFILVTGTVPAVTGLTSFFDDFEHPGDLEEAGSMSESSSPDYWVNSGGYMTVAGGWGGTIQGSLPEGDYWRQLYADDNPEDTDGGYYPQNIFRLVTRSSWLDVRQEATFMVTGDNLSESPNRDCHNGLLLFSRYLDSDNLYYAGIRVDGYAVIKKKMHGDYYTMAYNKVLQGSYNRGSNPSLIPKDTPIALRAETTDQLDGSVQIKLYSDIGGTGNWTLVAQAVDSGSGTGGTPINSPGFAGIRTDFMDVLFDNYSIDDMSAPPEPPNDPPNMIISGVTPLWASYGDYLRRLLSVDWSLKNLGADAFICNITNAVNNRNVTLETPLPYALGDIGTGGTVTGRLKYSVPSGVSGWAASITLSVEDGQGNVHNFPD